MDEDARTEGADTANGLQLRGFSTALKLIWAALFAAVGALTLVRVLDTSTQVDVPAVNVRSSTGEWSLPAIERICREALAAHGDDPALAEALDYEPGQRLGNNASAPDRILTAWRVGSEGRRVTIYVDIEGSIAHCLVSESK